MPLVCCSCSVAVGEAGLWGLGGGRGGGGRGFWMGFSGGSGGGLSACLVGGIRATLGAVGEVGPGLVTEGGPGFRMGLDIW